MSTHMCDQEIDTHRQSDRSVANMILMRIPVHKNSWFTRPANRSIAYKKFCLSCPALESVNKTWLDHLDYPCLRQSNNIQIDNDTILQHSRIHAATCRLSTTWIRRYSLNIFQTRLAWGFPGSHFLYWTWENCFLSMTVQRWRFPLDQLLLEFPFWDCSQLPSFRGMIIPKPPCFLLYRMLISPVKDPDI